MSVLFQITGLPRSGTAFLSTLVNLCPSAIGFHELISTEVDWRGVLEKARTKYGYVADCGTYQYLPGATVEWSRKVFIDRPVEDSRLAAQDAFGYPIPPLAYNRALEASQAWVEKYNPLVIPFVSLWNVVSLREIWNHVFQGDVEFPEDKATLLLGMNVQRQEPQRVFAVNEMNARLAELF